jgi:hypothetical protein
MNSLGCNLIGLVPTFREFLKKYFQLKLANLHRNNSSLIINKLLLTVSTQIYRMCALQAARARRMRPREGYVGELGETHPAEAYA